MASPRLCTARSGEGPLFDADVQLLSTTTSGFVDRISRAVAPGIWEAHHRIATITCSATNPHKTAVILVAFCCEGSPSSLLHPIVHAWEFFVGPLSYVHFLFEALPLVFPWLD